MITSVSPQRPDDVVASLPEADGPAVAGIAERVRAAQRKWWGSPAVVRAGALSAAAAKLRDRQDEAAALIVREVGKPAGEAAGEVARAVSIVAYYAQACYSAMGEVYPPSGVGLLYTERRPHGVAGLITPWNFPFAIPLWKAAPALAVGNGVLLKPSPDAIGCASFLSDLLGECLPEGLFSLACGGPDTGAAVIANADVVSFTGSVRVGAQVSAAAVAAGVPVQCEMGGLNAAIVLPDADPEATAQMVAGAAMGYAGQKCTATRRVIVVGDNPPFIDALAAAVAGLKPADPAHPSAVVGPLINQRARSGFEQAVKEGKAAGGRLLAGGHGVDRGGYFVEAALFDGLPDDHRLACEEIFGPVATVSRAPDLNEGVRVANSVRYGLVTSVHGRDLDAILSAVTRLDTGLIKVNAPTSGVDFYAPFGGEKESSYGPREQGTAGLSFYTSTRTVTISPHGG